MSEVVRWRILDETVQAIKDRNEDLSPEELEAEVELAVREVRTQPYAASGVSSLSRVSVSSTS